MNPDKISEFIDNKILEFFSSGKSIQDVTAYLLDNITRYSKRDSFLDVSEDYLIENWSTLNFKIKYNSFYVCAARKRVTDLEWLDMKVFADLQKGFKLLLFKQKLVSKRIPLSITNDISV